MNVEGVINTERLEFTDNAVNGKKYRTRSLIIRDLKMDNVPVVIYGTGKFGKAVAECMISHDIPILCFLDEDRYWFEGKVLIVQGKEIQCLTKVQMEEVNTTYNLLLGMINYSLLSQLRNEFSRCHYIEYLDVFPPHIIQKTFLEENRETIREIYSILQDTESKKVLEAYLHARYTGDVQRLSKLIHVGDYLYDWELLQLSKNDVVVDGGAYIGDTIFEMRQYIGELPKKVFAFEPDRKNLEQLISKFNEEDNIQPVEAGLFSRDDTLHFAASGTLGSSISECAEELVSVQALDLHEKYKEVSVIKMDIEGSELEALRGCERLIRERRPRLAICIYHRNEDLLDIYNYLKQFSYQFYMRQHSMSVEETVLYAI